MNSFYGTDPCPSVGSVFLLHNPGHSDLRFLFMCVIFGSVCALVVGIGIQFTHGLWFPYGDLTKAKSSHVNDPDIMHPPHMMCLKLARMS